MFLVPFHHLQMKVVSSENKKFGYFTVAYVRVIETYVSMTLLMWEKRREREIFQMIKE